MKVPPASVDPETRIFVLSFARRDAADICNCPKTFGYESFFAAHSPC